MVRHRATGDDFANGTVRIIDLVFVTNDAEPKDQGILTEAEFDAPKAQILGP